MVVAREIEALAEVGPRPPGSDRERRAARVLEDRLSRLGRDVRLEAIEIWPRWALAHSAHAVLAALGGLVAVGAPVAGTAVAAVATVSALVDCAGRVGPVRRLTGRRLSQNVVSTEGEGERKAGTIVLVAHVDSGRGGLLFSPPLERIAARVSLPLLFLVALALLTACCAARVAGVDGRGLTAVQFLPTVALILSVPLLVGAAIGPVSPGANDDGSGIETVVRLAAEHGGGLASFDLWVLLAGGNDALLAGARAFRRRHRRELARDRTVFVNVDAVGAGMVRYSRREGLLRAAPVHPQLTLLSREIAEDAGGAATPVVARPGSGVRRHAAITVTCRDGHGLKPRHRASDDLPDSIDPGALADAFAFCSELIARLDAEVGPRLGSARR